MEAGSDYSTAARVGMQLRRKRVTAQEVRECRVRMNEQEWVAWLENQAMHGSYYSHQPKVQT